MGQMTSRLVPTWKAGPADSPTTWGRQQGSSGGTRWLFEPPLNLGAAITKSRSGFGSGLALPCSTSIALTLDHSNLEHYIYASADRVIRKRSHVR